MYAIPTRSGRSYRPSSTDWNVRNPVQCCSRDAGVGRITQDILAFDALLSAHRALGTPRPASRCPAAATARNSAGPPNRVPAGPISDFARGWGRGTPSTGLAPRPYLRVRPPRRRKRRRGAWGIPACQVARRRTGRGPRRAGAWRRSGRYARGAPCTRACRRRRSAALRHGESACGGGAPGVAHAVPPHELGVHGRQIFELVVLACARA
ncbi:hypothetical protein HYPSUDRAFT_623624 [Hypholoma sublateritium FD-334 SS-4]|uniref:Uncharacterized protein n=1 Tax=Hypholoma sublateritium (strain FD-334 SS-4) TaxID=945553 RepID=A0A0D2PDE1_HYPSF|nr:hypothetical protein HYPSUDRAFT_623624 [Hypholoma sublateritium FD-334 SS-4]